MSTAARDRRRAEERKRRASAAARRAEFLGSLEAEVGGSAPWQGPFAAKALSVLLGRELADVRRIIEGFDYESVVRALLDAYERAEISEDTSDRLGAIRALEEVLRVGADGPDLFDPRGTPFLTSAFKRVCNHEWWLDLHQAGLIRIEELDRSLRTRVSETRFSLEDWDRSPALDFVAQTAKTPYGDDLRAALNEAVSNRLPFLPSHLSDIDRAVRVHHPFGLNELFFVLHGLWSSIPEGRSIRWQRGQVVGEFQQRCRREAPWVLERTDLGALVDYLTIPFASQAHKRDRLDALFMNTLPRPLIALPSGTSASTRPASVAPALVTSEAMVGNALGIWLEMVQDGDWPVRASDNEIELQQALTRRRGNDRPRVEFERQVVTTLTDLGMRCAESVTPAAARQRDIVLRNEIDAIAFDAGRRIAWILECKDLKRPWTAREMKNRVKEYLREDSKSFAAKLAKKCEDAHAAGPKLSELVGDEEPSPAWAIVGLFLTRYRDPATSLRGLRYPVLPLNVFELVIEDDAFVRELVQRQVRCAHCLALVEDRAT